MNKWKKKNKKLKAERTRGWRLKIGVMMGVWGSNRRSKFGA